MELTSSDGDVHGTKTSSWDLGYKNPADGSPAELEENGEDEDTCQCNVAERWDLLGLSRWVESDVETNEEHGNTLSNGRQKEGLATTEGVCDKCEENHACNDLDETVDTSGEQTGVCALDTESQEDSWGVVVDGVTEVLLAIIN